MHVLFVCTGNTCRSPMAEAMLRHISIKKGMQDIEVRSAGVSAYDGAAAAKGTMSVLNKKGITHEELTGSRALTEELVQWADYIFTMTASHKDAVLFQFPQAQPKVFTLAENDIADPFGGDEAIYEECARELEVEIEKLADKLESKHVQNGSCHFE